MYWRCISYRTIYCIGEEDKGFASHACFGAIFNSSERESESTYRILVDTTDESILKNHYSNFAPFDKTFIRNYVKLGFELIGKKSKVLVGDYVWNKRKYVRIAFHVGGKKLYHKFILAWTRLLYEFPYNLLLFEAHEFMKAHKDNPKYSFVSLINMISLLNRTVTDVGSRRTGDFELHSLIDPGSNSPFYRNKGCIKTSLEYLINEHYNSRLNSVFTKSTSERALSKGDFVMLSEVKRPPVAFPGDLHEFLENREEREVRFSVYREILDKISKKFSN